jgi:DnaK suppressor protein
MTEPLSPQVCRERYLERLRAEADEIIRAGEDTQEDRKPVVLDQQSVGRLSRMDALQGQALAQAMQSRRSGRLRAIAAAVDRLKGEDFGWCGDCGEFIGVRRLDLDPTLQRCVSCVG